MKIIKLIQGAPEWHQYRAGRNQHGQRRRPASLVPVMMGKSPHMTRSELVRIWATGDEREFTEWERKFLLEKGLQAEASARVLLEEDLGEEFYPVTISDDVDLNTASLDGLQINDEDGFEHKLWNVELAAAIGRKDPPPYIYWQLEGQLLAGVGSLKRVHLVCSDGTRENRVSMVYEPVPGRHQQIVAAWKQFEDDVANYQHVEVIPKAVADPVMGLPAVSVQVKGDIAIISNLDLFGERLKAFIDGLNKTPETDQDFANADQAVKVLKEAEDRLEAAESAALAQTASVDDMRRTVAMYRDLARTTRLSVGKLVEARKATIRAEIQQEGIRALASYIEKANASLGKPYMPPISHDFPGVMKGKKTIASLRDAVANELARCKIVATEIANRIHINLAMLREQVAHEFLFADAATIVLKANDDFGMLVRERIAKHHEKVQAEAEAAREKIRQEEQAKLAVSQAAPPAPAVIPAPAAGAATVITPARGRPATSRRPSDGEIIAALAAHFNVPEPTVIGWLTELDLESVARSRVAANA